ncbi:hypothetical protein Slala03_57110 [Streptomyces lavendulae subsp. lavendulae]|nr:hypothetical protein Slala03_57110 [Streptomyces lavendulae subsp. lavendulae]
MRASAWQAMKPASAGSEQSRRVCTAEAEAPGAAGAAEASAGDASAHRPPDNSAAADRAAVTARRVSLVARQAGFDGNELPSMGGRIPAARDVAPMNCQVHDMSGTRGHRGLRVAQVHWC